MSFFYIICCILFPFAKLFSLSPCFSFIISINIDMSILHFGYFTICRSHFLCNNKYTKHRYFHGFFVHSTLLVSISTYQSHFHGILFVISFHWRKTVFLIPLRVLSEKQQRMRSGQLSKPSLPHPLFPISFIYGR